MKVYSFEAKIPTGEVYNVRLLLTEEELEGLQTAGVVPKTGIHEVIGWVYANPELVLASKVVEDIRVSSFSKN